MNPGMETLFHDAVIPGSGWPGDPASETTPVAPLAGSVSELANSSPDLQELSARVSVCRACPRLVAWREEVAQTKRKAYANETYWGRPAPGFGDDEAGLAIVGLAPAAHGANRTGRVFTGDRTGDFLTAALARAGFANQSTSTHAGDGLELVGARLLSAVRCAPPKNLPTPAEQATCAPWLDRELVLVSPVVILALGGIGWKATCAALARAGWALPRPRPKFGHGAEFVATRGEPEPGGTGRGWARIAVVGCYHPSQQNTFTGKLTGEMMDAVLSRCRALVKGEGDY
ncbi:MAG TPA: uracil-DNA glycosylase [Beutenbergiaceae bacterium]|nr:uracil-DNA glycosylase [Beutenbergiaceae bacterium]